MGAGSVRERAARLRERLERLGEELERVLVDEISEAHAYRDFALSVGDEEARWLLAVVAMDSILHRELLWAVRRALFCINLFLAELEQGVRRGGEAGPEAIAPHEFIEDLAKTSYEELRSLAEPGTSLYRLFEMLESEERKHLALVERVLSILSGHRGGEGGSKGLNTGSPTAAPRGTSEDGCLVERVCRATG